MSNLKAQQISSLIGTHLLTHSLTHLLTHSLIYLLTYLLTYSLTHSGVSLFKKELYERAIPHFREQMDELVNAFGYMESNTIMTIQNLAANIGCLAEKRIAQLRAEKAEYNEMLMEQIMGGLDEAIELCKTVIEYSYEAYRYSLTHSLTHSLTYVLTHVLTQLSGVGSFANI